MALPGRHWEPASSPHGAACGFIYFSVSKFYNLDYRTMKKGDSTEMEVTAARARCPVASVVSGVIGVSGGGVEGRIQVFRAQCAPVPYTGTRGERNPVSSLTKS